MRSLFVILLTVSFVVSCDKSNETSDLSKGGTDSYSDFFKDESPSPWETKGYFKFKLLRPAPTNDKGEVCACTACFGFCGEGAVTISNGASNNNSGEPIDINIDDIQTVTALFENENQIKLVFLEVPFDYDVNLIIDGEASILSGDLFNDGISINLKPGTYTTSNEQGSIDYNGVEYPTYGSVIIDKNL